MNAKTLGIATIVVIALLALALLATGQRDIAESNDQVAGESLFPALIDGVNEVQSITISRGEPYVTLARVESAWQVLERDGYPADTQQVRQVLLTLANAEIRERKTARPENYAAIGVESPTGETGNVLITLDGEHGALIVGDRATTGNGTFVRKPDDAVSLLVSGRFDLPVGPDEWLDKTIVDISADQVRAVTVTHADGEVLNIAKQSTDDLMFEVTDKPVDRDLSSPSAPGSLASALANLRLDDVRPQADFTPADEAVTQFVLETFTGLAVRVRAASDDDRYLLAFEADALAPTPVSPGEPEDASLAEAPEADANAQAEAIANRTTGWWYQVPKYKYDALTKRLEDLLAPLPEPEAATTDS